MQNIFEKILGGKFKREITELYVSMAIHDLATWMLDIFEPIFIFTLFHSLIKVVLFYAVAYTLYVFLLPIGGKIAARYGFEHSIFYSIPVAIIYYVILYNMPSFPYLCFYLGALLLAIFKILFWPAYHANFAHYGNSDNRGGEVSGIFALSNIIGIIGPLLGGLIIAKFGFKALYFTGALMYFISAIPLFTTAEQFTPGHFSYKDAFGRIIKPQGVYTRRDQIAYMACAEEFSAYLLWPMFIYFTVGSISKMGGLITASLLFVAIITVYIGRLANNSLNGKKIFKWSVILNSFIWLIRPFVASIIGIFSLDVISRNLYNSLWVPFMSFIYKKGEKTGYLKYVMFFEMNLAIGKMLFAWLLLIILCFTQSWFVLFGITGIIGLLYLNFS
ncbi:MAG: MFS transporter [bacterium]